MADVAVDVATLAYRYAGGSAIDRGLAAYWHDLYGTGSRTIEQLGWS